VSGESPTTPAYFGGPPLPPAPRRLRVLIGALVGTALLIAGGVFAAVKLTQHDGPAGTAASSTATAPNAGRAPNTGPFTGIYTAKFGPTTLLDPDPALDPGLRPSMGTYAVRWVCRPTGCVATASKLGGDASFASTIEFDEANGSWVAVALSSDECRGAPAEAWQVFKLQPRPDGALTGEYTATTSNSCGGKSTVTLTRTGDVDLDSLPDPVTLPPRALSPAEALSGR
jgi:hypothetical protein